MNKAIAGIYITYPQSRLIYDGKKDLIVKTRKIVKHLDTLVYLVDKRLCYGIVKLSLEKEGGIDDFKKLYGRHRISESRRKRWWEEATKFWFYKIEILEKFPYPKSWDYNDKIKSYVSEVNFIQNRKFSDITLSNITNWRTKELIIVSLKLSKAYESEKKVSIKNELMSQYLLLWSELSNRDIKQDKSTPLYKQSRELKSKLEEYGFGLDFIDTFQRIGLNALFDNTYGIKIKKRDKRRMKMYSNINFKFYPQIVTRSEDGEGNWYVEGYAATSNPVDDKKSPYPVIIPDEELDRAAVELKGTTVFLNHDPKQHIGKVADMVRKGKKLWVKVFVSKTVPIIWTQIQEGVLNSFSIKGEAKKVIDRFDGGLQKMVRFVREFVWKETSIVGRGADNEARTLCWQVARALDDMEGEEIVQDTLKDVKDFTADRMKLKDIFPKIAEQIAHKYNKCADDLELIKKQQLIAEGGMVEGENAVICYITTGAQDRYNEILDPDGMITDEYLANPIVLWAHNHRELPIGRCDGLWQDKKGWIAKTIYAVDSNPMAKMVYQHQKSGNSLAKSVGYIPLEWVNHNEEEDSGCGGFFGPPPESGKMQVLKRTYTKWILLEYSDVPIPANPECLPIVVLEADRVKMYSKDTGEKPYPNFHSCRLKPPANYDTCRTTSRTHDGKKYNVITCRRKDDHKKWEEQAYRYSKDIWTASSAKSHCKSHGGTFHPAGKKEVADVETKGVIGYSVHGDGPKASEDTPWNAGAEVKKASGNAKKLRKMHTWVDSGADNYDADERQWYKLPHHKGDGSQAVVWRGVANAAARLPQTNIPQSDKKGCQTHLGKHYKQFDKEPPWEKSIKEWERYCEICEAVNILSDELPDFVKLLERNDLYKKLFSEEVTDMDKQELKEVIKEALEEKEEKKEEQKEEEKEEVKTLSIEDVETLINEKLSAFKAELLKELKPEEKAKEKVEEKKEEKPEGEKEEEKKEEEGKEEEKPEKRETVVRSDGNEEIPKKTDQIPYSLKNLHKVVTKKINENIVVVGDK